MTTDFKVSALPKTDREIRAALHHKKFKQFHACSETLVVSELGLAHARARVDIAVINGCIHGFEIKSAGDTLARLSTQLGVYSECLEKLTLVCTERHLKQVVKVAPAWCGIIEASKGTRGAISFKNVRAAVRNPGVRSERLAHLLWHSEAVELLMRLGVPGKQLKKPRKQLYEQIAEILTIKELTAEIREFMRNRRGWRRPPMHASYDG